MYLLCAKHWWQDLGSWDCHFTMLSTMSRGNPKQLIDSWIIKSVQNDHDECPDTPTLGYCQFLTAQARIFFQFKFSGVEQIQPIIPKAVLLNLHRVRGHTRVKALLIFTAWRIKNSALSSYIEWRSSCYVCLSPSLFPNFTAWQRVPH